MRQTTGSGRRSSEKIIKDIKRATRKQYSSEEKIRIVLDGLRGEDSIAELCRREGISQGVYDWPIGRIWMNPPYAQPLMGQCATKYAEAIESGSTGIALVNYATETSWFQEIVSVSSAVCFHKARIRFVGDEGQSGAPLQGQAIIYAGNDPLKFEEVFRDFGMVMADFPANMPEAA